jgi:hypothetical protein
MLRQEVNAFLRKTGMAPSRLGREAVNDPAFVNRLNHGSEPRRETAIRVRHFMSAYEAKP